MVLVASEMPDDWLRFAMVVHGDYNNYRDVNRALRREQIRRQVGVVLPRDLED